MRLGTIAVVFVIAIGNTSRIEASPHGGAHTASAPKPPHFSPPPVPHFSQPTPSNANVSHSNVSHANAVNQGGYNSGYMPHYSQPRSSTANRTKTNTKLHNLANALQNAHATNANSTVPHSAKGQTSALDAAEASGSVATNTNPRSIVSAGQGTAASDTSANTTTSGSQPAITGKLSLSSTGTSGSSASSNGQPAIRGTFSLANAGNSGTPPGKAFGLSTTGPNLSSVSGASTGTAPNVSSSPATTVSATNPNGTSIRLTPAYLSLMSELYGPYGFPHYGVVSSGRRYYGSRSYGNRNNGNQNNSMYFAQMRRLARLANDLNTLSRGSAVSTNMTSRIRGDLMGVVFGNGMPPYQTVHQLSMDLVTHLPSRATPMFNSGQLARDLMVAMNGSGHNMSQIQSAIGSAHSLLNMTGVNRQGIQKIVADMTMVASWGNGGNALTQLR